MRRPSLTLGVTPAVAAPAARRPSLRRGKRGAIAYRWPRLAPLIKSRATPLIVDGEINARALRREFMRRAELAAELRLHGITDVREVAWAYLEPNGMVSVIGADRAEADDPAAAPTIGRASR